jgi:outer membrane protein TolC
MRAELVALALLLPGVARAQTAAAAPELTAAEGFSLDDALRAARQNPGLAAPRSLARAAEADVGAVSRWSNPQLGVSYMRSFGFTTFDPDLGVPQVGVTQLIETAGLPGRRQRAATAERDAARLDVRRAMRSLALTVIARFVRLAVATQRGELLREAMQQTQDFAALVSARVAAGSAPGYERTRANLAVRAAQIALGDALADAEASRADFDLAVGPASITLRGAPRMDLAAAPALPPLAELVASLPRARIDLQVTEARAAAATARVDVARAEAVPGFQLYGGLLAGQGFGERGQRQVDFMVGMSVPLPLLNDGRDAVRAAEARAAAAREQGEAERAEARLRVEGAWRVAQRRRETAAEALRGREEQERLLRETTAAYRDGRVPVQALIDSHEAVRDLRLQGVEVLGAAREAEASLWEALGALPGRSE